MSMFMFDTAKPITQMAFNPAKTEHDITLSGYIYTQLNRKDESTIIADGSLTDLKLKAHKGEKWYLIDNLGNKLKGGAKGEWYIKRISQAAEHFITELNALKIEFTITIKKYR